MRLLRHGQANTSFPQPFSKLKLSRIPESAESETLWVEMPACEACVQWFRTTRTLLFSRGFVAITGLLWCVLLTMWLDNQLPIYVWFATIALWTALRLWRGWRILRPIAETEQPLPDLPG